MTTIDIDLNSLNADELAALQIAVRRHVSAALNGAILDAGMANCGFDEFNALRKDIIECHFNRLHSVPVYYSNTLKRNVTIPEN